MTLALQIAIKALEEIRDRSSAMDDQHRADIALAAIEEIIGHWN